MGNFVCPTAPLLEGGLSFVPLEADHFFAIDLQDSQRLQYGLDPLAMSYPEAQHYAGQDNAWAVLRGDAVLAILGVSETFAGVQGVAFALLADGLGRDHLAVTRFARDVVIGTSPLRRIEAIVPCADLPEEIEAKPAGVLREVNALLYVTANATPPVRWGEMVGLSPAAVLRNFGAASETHLLMERIR